MTSEVKQLLKALQQTAEATIPRLVFPNTKQEEWKYTDPSALQSIRWQTALPQFESTVTPIPEAEFALVFANGTFIPDRSVVEPGELLVLGSVLTDNSSASLLSAHLGKYTDDWDMLSQINSSSCEDLSLIYVPQNYADGTIVALHYLNQGQHSASHPRCLVVLAPHSRLTIVEVHQGNEDVYWANPLTEIYVGEQAVLNHIIWQHQGLSAFHTQTTRVVQAKNSFYQLQTIDVGAQLSRHNLHVQLQGDATSTTLEGLVTIGANQTSDTYSTIVHSHPSGRSNQLHKCILRDHSHGVFSGQICVTKQGQLTDAQQMSRNLLLSPHARIDTKPQLQIVADNVKCTHGATVSQLDREEQFYLQSRGIDPVTATNLLTYAFAGEILQNIPIASVREAIVKLIFAQTIV
ncbi:MAG: Fe-S cluster assembly protein SufD [Cyanobacteria bacterium KgW148]|nr:Fe-S cluster assembly protein SufD [Cyanobacteria bacterium KgW148]